MTRILIADDHEVVRAGLRSVLEAHDGWSVVAEAADGKDAVGRAIALRPDVAIIDYSLPLLNGVEVTRQVRGRLPSTEVLIFTMHESDALVEDMLEAGARGYLLKSDASQHLIAAVQALARHQPYFTGRLSERLLESFLANRNQAPQPGLTTRERMVVKLVAEGHTNKEIGAVLNLSIKTVETHRAAALKRLNLSSTAALVRYAVRNKLIEP
jgi:DNA-binding NarL/FixJ family response regulator